MTKELYFGVPRRVLTCPLTFSFQNTHICVFLDKFSFGHFLATSCYFQKLRLNSLNCWLIFRKSKKNFCRLNKLVCCYTKSPLFFSKILKQVHACLFLTEVVSIILTNEIPIVYINKVVSFARSKKDQRKLFHSNVTLLYVPSTAYWGPCHITMFWTLLRFWFQTLTIFAKSSVMVV